ncbi:hypothetical protein [Priestia megaterium]|uniref:hypothetical protein n=1 Tax=Priestia megaterium TaxID=1404 RepID=UPI0028781576|nr:hypothetical protein [Priestia megaterium]
MIKYNVGEEVIIQKGESSYYLAKVLEVLSDNLYKVGRSGQIFIKTAGMLAPLENKSATETQIEVLTSVKGKLESELHNKHTEESLEIINEEIRKVDSQLAELYPKYILELERKHNKNKED